MVALILEEGDDMMPGLDNSGRKQLETKIEDICVIRRSKPSGDYIMIFYRPKEVSCKKTESGGHTRQGARPGGRARPPPSWMPRVPFVLLLIFLFS